VTPVLTRGTYHWVVALVDYELSTPAVFARFDELSPDAPDPVPPEMLMGALAGGGADELGRHLENDLQPAAVALRPSLQALLDEGIDSGAVGALLSGSGPTCLFLARDADHATRIAVNLAASGLCRDVRVASGPVPGASVV
jgi:4-diphosphocytidyl-2-C-methyl-D-erythritol kinase